MSRFVGDDYDPQFANEWDLWEANWLRHLRGANGQEVLRDLRDALLALPERKLIEGRLADEQGCVCTVGALALYRRTLSGERPEDVLDELRNLIKPDERWGDIDAYEAEERTVACGVGLGLKRMMAMALAGKNDDWYADDKTPEQRFERVLKWVESKIADPVAS